jgi:hypothetical protein
MPFAPPNLLIPLESLGSNPTLWPVSGRSGRGRRHGRRATPSKPRQLPHRASLRPKGSLPHLQSYIARLNT